MTDTIAKTKELEQKQNKSKVADKLYNTTEITDIMKDVAKDYTEQVALMTDKELLYDRSHWILNYGDGNGSYDENTYEVDIHTLAILLEQIRRFKRIYYEPKKELIPDENKGHQKIVEH